MCLAQGSQRSYAGKALTRGPSVSSQVLPLSHCFSCFLPFIWRHLIQKWCFCLIWVCSVMWLRVNISFVGQQFDHFCQILKSIVAVSYTPRQPKKIYPFGQLFSIRTTDFSHIGSLLTGHNPLAAIYFQRSTNEHFTKVF